MDAVWMLKGRFVGLFWFGFVLFGLLFVRFLFCLFVSFKFTIFLHFFFSLSNTEVSQGFPRLALLHSF